MPFNRYIHLHSGESFIPFKYSHFLPQRMKKQTRECIKYNFLYKNIRFNSNHCETWECFISFTSKHFVIKSKKFTNLVIDIIILIINRVGWLFYFEWRKHKITVKCSKNTQKMYTRVSGLYRIKFHCQLQMYTELQPNKNNH